MSKVTQKTSGDKPSKPSPDFPLFPHKTGYWAKKVRQKLYYFGKVSDDPDGTLALQKWLARKDELIARGNSQKNDKPNKPRKSPKQPLR